MSTIIDISASTAPQRLTHRQARAIVAGIIDSPETEEFSVKEVLLKHPGLSQYGTCIIDLALEEYIRCQESGREVAAADFVKGFSQVQQSLFKVLEIDQALRDCPEIIQEFPEERWPVAGDIFCGFELEELIGRGAVSRVFVAQQVSLRRRVVLKVCVRGEREAALLGQLEFEGIAPIHSIHAEPQTGLTAICMPYLTRVTMHGLAEILTSPDTAISDAEFTGENICSYIRKINRLGGLESSDTESVTARRSVIACQPQDGYATLIMKWGIQLARALQYAHDNEILHCDVKPGNVLLFPDLSASLLDFNLASADGEAIRWAGGTLPYMASEQLHFLIESFSAGSTPERLPQVSRVTDVFGLCATLWEMVTGEPPFGFAPDSETRSKTATILAERQQAGVDARLVSIAETILPRKAVALLLKGLSYDPKLRPQSVAEFSNELRTYLPATVSGSMVWLVVPVLLMLAVILVAAALRESTSTSDNATAIVSEAETVANAIEVGMQFVRAQQFEAACDAVQPYLYLSPACRYIDLYCRSCELPGYPHESRTVMSADNTNPDEQQQEAAYVAATTEQWTKVIGEWSELARQSDHPLNAAAWYNVSWICLECRCFDQSAEAFLRASTFSELPESSPLRLKTAVDAFVGDYEAIRTSLPVLGASLNSLATSGEFHAYAEGTMRLFEFQATGFSETDRQVAVSALLTAFGNSEQVSSEDYWVALRRLNAFKSVSTRVRAAAIRSRDNSPVNNLSQVLLSPDACVTPR